MSENLVDPATYEAAVERLLAGRRDDDADGTERITTLAELLGRPDQTYPSIHVTGANGKGSVAQMAATLLGALGLTAGCYTSPHYQDVRERIRVAAEPVTRETLLARVAELEPFLVEIDARHAEPATSFEVLTALAYAHFADAPVDVGVFEVGTGGERDATNLVRGEVAVLTPVAGSPGDGSAALAQEMAGIIKPGGVAVTAPQPDPAARVIERVCGERGAHLVTVPDDAVESRSLAVGGQVLDLRGETGGFEGVYVPLHGRHQGHNAALALTAVEAFLGFAGGLDPAIIREGFAAVRLPGRLEVVRRTDASTVVLDAARDGAAASALAATLRDEFAFRHRVLVLGLRDGDDLEGTLAPLLELAAHVVVTTSDEPAAMPSDRLAGLAGAAGASVETAEDVAAGIELASGLSKEEDGVVVTGTPAVVGAARVALGLGVA